MLNYKTRLPDLLILMETLLKRSNYFWKVDQQQWQQDSRIGNFNNPTEEIFYSIKERTTSHEILNYDESSLNHSMTMKQQDTRGRLGLIMQYDSTTGGRALDFLGR